MYNYKMLICYDGTRYSGWQRQGNTGATIQARLERNLSELLGEAIEISGSGRTDAGVHARGQVANFHTEKQLDCTVLLRQLNSRLPEDIAVLSISPAAPRFHARLSARSKTYCYTVNTSCIPDVFASRFEYRLGERLELAPMKTAADLLLGTHDFRGFSTGHTKKSTIRTITAIELRQEGDKLMITFTGDGFLYNMVRILTGTLLEVGLGKRPPESIPEIFQTRNRTQAGFTAPAQGLCLVCVEY